MSAPPTSSSSGAAEAGEEVLMTGDDIGDVGRLRGRIPHTALKRPAEQYPVGPREHVAEIALSGVADLRLGFEDRELAADGSEELVAEQVPAAKPGAVEHQGFRQGRDIGWCRELADFDPAAGDLNIAGHLAEVTARLDVHHVRGGDAVEREGVLGSRQHPIYRREVGDDLVFDTVGLDVGRQPADSVV